jgi:KDO2-lipid IV(A) lauroyltransferase
MKVQQQRGAIAWLESLGYEAYFRGFQALPIERASDAGAALLRTIGPLTPVHKVARTNLRLVFPELSEERAQKILADSWGNFGRTVAEFPHLHRVRIYEPGSRVEVVNAECFDRAMAEGKGAVFVGGHFANWEVLAASVAQRVKARMTYRALNNYFVDQRIQQQRIAYGRPDQNPKGVEGGMGLMRALKDGWAVAIMNDQKYNEGVAAPFFGRLVMTADGPTRLSRRFRCPLVPVGIERLAGARFRITVQDPIPYDEDPDEEAAVARTVGTINAHVEAWVRANPEQWFWVHRRWPKEIYRAPDAAEAADRFSEKARARAA